MISSSFSSSYSSSCFFLLHKEQCLHVTETPHYTNEIFTCLYSFWISSLITLWKTVKCNTYKRSIRKQVHDRNLPEHKIAVCASFLETITCGRPLFQCVCELWNFQERGAVKKGRKGERWKMFSGLVVIIDILGWLAQLPDGRWIQWSRFFSDPPKKSFFSQLLLRVEVVGR